MILMATGSEGGAYANVGERYREVLARAGVEVRLVPTAGSPENLALLLDRRSGVSVSLIQGGTIGAEASSQLKWLGAVFYEPMWLFYKRGLPNTGVTGDLKGRRISVGAVGSGTRALALELLKRNEIDGQVSELMELTSQAAGETLLSGELDATLTLNARDAPVAQQLLAAGTLELSRFQRADAYVALYPFLNKLVLPRGVVDLAKDRPPDDVILVAPKASLIVHKDLHPAIQSCCSMPRRIFTRSRRFFRSANQFPAAEAVDIPLSSEALLGYRSDSPTYESSSILGGGPVRQAAGSADSNSGRALPDPENVVAAV